jgi:hypothetical protein
MMRMRAFPCAALLVGSVFVLAGLNVVAARDMSLLLGSRMGEFASIATTRSALVLSGD